AGYDAGGDDAADPLWSDWLLHKTSPCCGVVIVRWEKRTSISSDGPPEYHRLRHRGALPDELRHDKVFDADPMRTDRQDGNPLMMRSILVGILVLMAAGVGWLTFDWYRGHYGGEPYGSAFTLTDQNG